MKTTDKRRTWLEWALLALGVAAMIAILNGGACLAHAQSSGPITTPAINKAYYYVGTSPYLTIQAAATAACAAAVPKGQVIVPANATPADTPTAATGCTGVIILVQTAGAAPSCYEWGSSGPYAIANCGGGGSSGLTGPYNLTNQVATFTNGALTAVGAPFGMGISCTAAGTFEIGYATTNPNTCTLSYSNGTPASATIGDGTHTTTLTSPYTSGNLAYSYTANTTFAGNATATNTQTASATTSATFLPRSFGGTGTGGSATGATASGTTAVLVGATGTLANGGLASSNVGEVYTVTTSGTQYVYLLLVTNVSNPTGGSFTTPGPTVFQMNAPTTISFTNQYAHVVTMYLYRSTNAFVSGTTNVITVGN